MECQHHQVTSNLQMELQYHPKGIRFGSLSLRLLSPTTKGLLVDIHPRLRKQVVSPNAACACTMMARHISSISTDRLMIVPLRKEQDVVFSILL